MPVAHNILKKCTLRMALTFVPLLHMADPQARWSKKKSRALDRKIEQDRAHTPERNQKKHEVRKAKTITEEIQQCMSLIGSQL